MPYCYCQGAFYVYGDADDYTVVTAPAGAVAPYPPTTATSDSLPDGTTYYKYNGVTYVPVYDGSELAYKVVYLRPFARPTLGRSPGAYRDCLDLPIAETVGDAGHTASRASITSMPSMPRCRPPGFCRAPIPHAIDGAEMRLRCIASSA